MRSPSAKILQHFFSDVLFSQVAKHNLGLQRFMDRPASGKPLCFLRVLVHGEFLRLFDKSALGTKVLRSGWFFPLNLQYNLQPIWSCQHVCGLCCKADLWNALGCFFLKKSSRNVFVCLILLTISIICFTVRLGKLLCWNSWLADKVLLGPEWPGGCKITGNL